jgi:predicted nucleotidyltransferase
MDIKSLLKSLNGHKVRYVIIGAYAFPFYGYSRATIDLDIFIEPVDKNVERTLHALSQFGYDVSDVTVQDMMEKKILIRQYALETDVHPMVTGMSFEQIWKNKKRGEIEGVETYFASLDDLIKMKEAAGREKDLQDLEILRRLKSREI